jgi:hypothetical protein
MAATAKQFNHNNNSKNQICGLIQNMFCFFEEEEEPPTASNASNIIDGLG